MTANQIDYEVLRMREKKRCEKQMHQIITNSKDNQCQRTNTLIPVERNVPVQDERVDTPTVTQDISL